MPLQHAESNQTVGWLVETEGYEGEREEGRGVSVRRLAWSLRALVFAFLFSLIFLFLFIP